MQLITNQLRLIRRMLASAKWFIISSIAILLNDIRQLKVRRHIGKNMVHNILNHEEIILQLRDTAFSADSVRISFVAAVRRLGNPNHRLGAFLESVVKNAKTPEQIEVILGIDSDDDITYYVALKERFKNRLRFRIFILPQRHGYVGLHLYDKELLPRMAPNSRMMCDYSDDCVITLHHFDVKLMAIDAQHPDNIYFIHTQESSRADYLGDLSKEPLRLYWALQAKAPHSYFPIISRKAIECAEEALADLPLEERSNWSPFASGWVCDCYIDILSNHVKALGVDRIFALPIIKIKSYNIFTPYQFARDNYALTASNRAFIHMLSQKTQAHLMNIARRIAKAATSK